MNRFTETGNINRTIFTLENREGDSWRLLEADAVRYRIYDPLSVRPDPSRPTHYVRTPLAGNIIPKSRMINPTYTHYVKFLPKPNNDPTDPRREPLSNCVAVAMPPVVIARQPGAWLAYPYLFEREPGLLWIFTGQGKLQLSVREKDLVWWRR